MKMLLRLLAQAREHTGWDTLRPGSQTIKFVYDTHVEYT